MDKLLGEGIALADDRRHAQSCLAGRRGAALGILVDNAARAGLVAEGVLRAATFAALGAVAVLELTVLVELEFAAIDAFLRLAALGEGSVLLVGTPRPAALEAAMLACVFAREAAIVGAIFLEGGVATRSAVEIACCAVALLEGLAVIVALFVGLALAVVLIEGLTLAVALLECAVIIALAVRLAIAIALFEFALAVAPVIVIPLAVRLSVVVSLAVGLTVAVPLLREGLAARATVIATLSVGFTVVGALVVEGLAGAMLAVAGGAATRVALAIAALAAFTAVSRALVGTSAIAVSLRTVGT